MKEIIDIYKELEEQSLIIGNIYNNINITCKNNLEDFLYNIKMETKKEDKLYENLNIEEINKLLNYINDNKINSNIDAIDIIASSKYNNIKRIIRKLVILKKKIENNLFTDIYMAFSPLVTMTDNHNNNYQNIIEIYNTLFIANYITILLKNKKIPNDYKKKIIYRLSYIEPNLERYLINNKYNIDINDIFTNIRKIKELYLNKEIYKEISITYVEDKIKLLIEEIVNNSEIKKDIEILTDICISYTLTETEEESKIFMKYLKELLNNEKYKNNYSAKILLKKLKWVV